MEFLISWLSTVVFIIVVVAAILTIKYTVLYTYCPLEDSSIPEEPINDAVTNPISPVVLAIGEEFDKNPTDFKIVSPVVYRNVNKFRFSQLFKNRHLGIEGDIYTVYRHIRVRGIVLNEEEEQYLYSKYESYTKGVANNLNEQAKEKLLTKIKENK